MNEPHHLDAPAHDATIVGGLEEARRTSAQDRRQSAEGAVLLLALLLTGCGMPRQDELWPPEGAVSNQVRALQKGALKSSESPAAVDPGAAQNAQPVPAVRCMATLGAVDCYQDDPPPAPVAAPVAAPMAVPAATQVTPVEAPVAAQPLPRPLPLAPLN